jgi:glycosyltransferase involved in cell wall biosynthesis
MIKVMILGSKEYPFGSNRGDDPIPSGGMETYVNDLAPELSRLCRLVIITRKFAGTERHEKMGENIEIFRVPWLKGKWLRNPSFNIFSFLAALKTAGKSDVIYSNGVISGLFGLLLGSIFRKKTVFRPAGIGFIQYKAPIRNLLFALESMVFKKSDAVIFHSDGEKRNSLRLVKFRREKGHVILTGFPVERFKSGSVGMRKSLAPENEVLITSVSRFVPVKGIDYLIEACSMLRGVFRLVLVGSGPEEGRLRAMAQDLHMKDRVLFLGFRLDIPDILASTDIFVISSLFEGLPTSLLEAMAAGAACVVTDIGLPVENMKTGAVVEPKNPEALKEAIQVLMSNKNLRAQLGSNARKFVEENCTQEMAAKRHMEVFGQLLGQRNL